MECVLNNLLFYWFMIVMYFVSSIQFIGQSLKSIRKILYPISCLMETFHNQYFLDVTIFLELYQPAVL